MLLVLIRLSLPAAQAQDCPDPTFAIAEASQALAQARLEAAQVQLDTAMRATSCMAIPTDVLVDLLHVQGALLLFDGDEAGADFALEASRRLAADREPPQGPLVVDRWRGVVPTYGEPGSVRLRPLPEGWRVRADGAITSSPASLVPGVHLVQLEDPSGVVHWGRMIRVVSGISLDLVTGLPEIAPPAPVSALPAPLPATVPLHEPDRSRSARTALRVGGVGLLVLGGAGVVAAALPAGQIPSAPDVETLRRSRDLQVGLTGAGIALLGAGGTSLVVSFAF